MKAHFDPWKKKNIDSLKTPCGSNKALDYDWVWNWDQVTCKRCLEKRNELQELWENDKGKDHEKKTNT